MSGIGIVMYGIVVYLCRILTRMSMVGSRDSTSSVAIIPCML
jgi:hypothetical protein